MDFKQLRSFTAVVQYRSFTKAAEKTYLSQPTVSAHIRMLEEELHTRLLIRDTKNLEITPKGWELYECAVHILELQDHLLQRWAEESRHIIQLGASTIPSAYILPEILPQYGKLHPEAYFVVQQSDSSQVIAGLLGGLFDVGMTGMDCANEALTCIPFYRDRMVLITPVTGAVSRAPGAAGSPERAPEGAHHPAGEGERQPEKRRPLFGEDAHLPAGAQGHGAGQRPGVHQKPGGRRPGRLDYLGEGRAKLCGGEAAFDV